MRAGNTELILWLALAIGGGVACWLIEGSATTGVAARGSILLLLQILPLLVAAVLLGGYMQTLVSSAFIAKWLGDDSGAKGLFLASVAGALTPGGPFASFPLVVALFQAGAGMGTCVTYLTAWSVVSVPRLFIWELPILGGELSLTRFLVSIPLPIVAGLTARLLSARLTRAHETAGS